MQAHTDITPKMPILNLIGFRSLHTSELIIPKILEINKGNQIKNIRIDTVAYNYQNKE